MILFGSALFLVGQMYNVEAHGPLALLIWAAGATATAIVVRSRPVAWAALLIFTGWVGFEFGNAIDDSGDNWASFPVVAVFYGAALYGLGSFAPVGISPVCHRTQRRIYQQNLRYLQLHILIDKSIQS